METGDSEKQKQSVLDLHENLALKKKKRINEKWERKYVEVNCKMVEIQEQVDNNSGQINGICEILREQVTKLINVEVKINQDKEERIQVCEDLKEHKREIVNYIEEKIKIGNGTGHNVITNYSKIEREAPKFHPSKNQHPKVTKVEEYRNFKQFLTGFIKKYWGKKEESVMKSELYGRKFNHSLRQLKEEVLNKVNIIEVKKFDEVVRILEIYYECGRDGVRNDGNEYYNHYNNYEKRRYNHSGQGRNNHNCFQGPYQGNQFHYYNKN
ncbi:hypothetical protein FQA39_LY13203 [Lamprigera yunnana]|nr:hypothetical protein FQA39_LY13202 [Lamprigera yunnana]KAF5295198.1 hypothetical protein FQA39_LY13203 [Lamprigera yunnana]